jgi:hypothetical protein
MLPDFPANDSAYEAVANFVFNGQGCTAVQPISFLVFGEYLSHFILSKFCTANAFTFRASPTLLSVGRIILVGSLDDVAGIEAGRIIASMASARLWPSSMPQKKCVAMREEEMPLNPNLAISMTMPTEGPFQAFIGITVGLNRGFEIGKRGVTLCSRHLRSLSATVWAGSLWKAVARLFKFST